MIFMCDCFFHSALATCSISVVIVRARFRVGKLSAKHGCNACFFSCFFFGILLTPGSAYVATTPGSTPGRHFSSTR